MIKLGWLYINVFSLLLFAAAILVGALESMAVAYAVVTLHEMAHFAAARRYNISVSGFVIMPFGVCLRLKELNIDNPVQEIAVCAAGPVCNFALILLTLLLCRNAEVLPHIVKLFLYANISIMLINILPIMPLDGGRILRAVLTHKYGFLKSVRITNIVSQINIALIGLLGVYILYITHFNVSVMMICAFLLFNMSAEKRNGELTVMRQIIRSKEKLVRREIMPVKELAVMQHTDARLLLKSFSYNSYYLISVLDRDLSVLGVLTETQVINAAVRAKKSISVGCVLKAREK